MKKKLTFMEWSLNMRSDKNAQPHEAFYQAIKACVPQPDVLFLVETVKGNDFEVDGYIFVAESDNPIGNTTRLAVRSDLLNSGEIQVLGTCGSIPHTHFDEAPHYAQADVLFNGQVLNLIATRVLIHFGQNTAEEYRQRRQQFDLLTQHVSTLKNPVVMGDFNHGRILGFGKESANVVRHLFGERMQVQGDYFYQSMRESLLEHDLEIHTPNALLSCGAKVVDGVVQAEASPSWNYKIDHLLMRANTDAVKLEDIRYDWGHLEWALENGTNPDILKRKGFPDHAMLLATITVKSEAESEDQ